MSAAQSREKLSLGRCLCARDKGILHCGRKGGRRRTVAPCDYRPLWVCIVESRDRKKINELEAVQTAAH